MRGRSSASSERPLGIAFSWTETTSTTASRPVSKPRGTEIFPFPRSSGRTGTSSTFADQSVDPAGRVRSRVVPIAPGRRVTRSRCSRVPSRVISVVVSRRLATTGRLGAEGKDETAMRNPGASPASRQAAARSTPPSASRRAGGRSSRSIRGQDASGSGFTSAATEEARAR